MTPAKPVHCHPYLEGQMVTFSSYFIVQSLSHEGMILKFNYNSNF